MLPTGNKRIFLGTRTPMKSQGKCVNIVELFSFNRLERSSRTSIKGMALCFQYLSSHRLSLNISLSTCDRCKFSPMNYSYINSIYRNGLTMFMSVKELFVKYFRTETISIRLLFGRCSLKFLFFLNFILLFQPVRGVWTIRLCLST